MKWVDERFVHVLTPNIYRTWNEAVKSFDYITKRGNFGYIERESARWVKRPMYAIAASRVEKETRHRGRARRVIRRVRQVRERGVRWS